MKVKHCYTIKTKMIDTNIQSLSTKRNLFISSNLVYQKERTLFDQNVSRMQLRATIDCRTFEIDYTMSSIVDIDRC